ncbi:MAG: glutathione S-transferase family protein [Chromatiales bacterium]|jgi:glutathione S-transferase
MSSEFSQARFQLYYWPLPFRGCFVSYLFAYRDVPLLEAAEFEASLERGFFGADPVSFADIGVFALCGNMTRCLPELEADLLDHAPGVHALCQTVESKPSLAQFVADQERKYGKLYCGGQIEKSIRKMLEMDATW